MGLIDKVRDIDRRVIFLLMALGVSLPIIFQIPFPEITTPMVEKVYNRVNSMPPGSKVLVALDYDPGSEPELQPMANSFVRLLALRGCKLYFIALWPMGQNMIEDTTRTVLEPEFPDYVYGTDYVNLGFKSGGEGVIRVILTNLTKLYTTDGRGTAVEKIPMMADVRNLRNFALIVNVSAGFPGTKEWIQYGSDPAGVPIVAGCTAVQTPLFYPYYPNQLEGLMGGIKGAAELDEIVKKNHGDDIRKRYEQGLRAGLDRRLAELRTAAAPQAQIDAAEARFKEKLVAADKDLYLGLLRMGPQAVAHLIIMLLIIVGNITFFLERKRDRRKSAK